MLVGPIETQRLVIRQFKPDDWKEVYDYTSDPEVMAFIPEGPLTKVQAEEFVAKNGGEQAQAFAVILKTERRLIGHILFHPWFAPRTFEVGWVFNAAYQGSGYATEAASAVLSHGFKVLGLHRVIATCQPKNIPSFRVMEKLGMRREGFFQRCIYRQDDTWWDEYFYAILEDEWAGPEMEEMVIQSERLFVRPWKERDWKEFHLVMSSSRVHAYTDEEPWTVEKTRSVMDWFANHQMGWQWKAVYFNCPLILRSSGQLIGRVGLNPFQEEESIPEIEWTIGPEHWGKGYATEIGIAMLGYGFEQAGFEEIVGFTLPEHIASRKVMRKIGMEYVGDKQMREHIYSFYRIRKKDVGDGAAGR